MKTTMETTEGNGGGAMLRRAILLLAMAVAIAVMVAASAMPAFARGPSFEPKENACEKSELKAHFCKVS
jgi:hypothetical protein